MDLNPRAGDIVASFEDVVFAAASAMVFVGPQPPPAPPVPTEAVMEPNTTPDAEVHTVAEDGSSADISSPPSSRPVNPEGKAGAGTGVDGTSGGMTPAVFASGVDAAVPSRSRPSSPFDSSVTAMMGEVNPGIVTVDLLLAGKDLKIKLITPKSF